MIMICDSLIFCLMRLILSGAAGRRNVGKIEVL